MEVVVPASLIGLPTISIPCGFNTKGLPIGIQLIGNSYMIKRYFAPLIL